MGETGIPRKLVRVSYMLQEKHANRVQKNRSACEDVKCDWKILCVI
jgi:hypothetical protein